jgi:putative hydrolase of the HAD superfamily
MKALTLDASGVLLLPDPDVVRSVLARFDSEPDDSTCWRAHYEMIRLLDEAPEPDWPAMRRSFAAALGILPKNQDEAGRALVADVYLGTAWVAAPGAHDALRRLVADGYRLAVVSNTMHGEMEELLMRTQLCSVSGAFAPVAAVIDSQVVGVQKPDPRPFELALAALGVAASDCTHIGDSVKDDVVGAHAAGMAALHIDPLGVCGAGDHRHASSLAAFVADLLSD